MNDDDYLSDPDVQDWMNAPMGPFVNAKGEQPSTLVLRALERCCALLRTRDVLDTAKQGSGDWNAWMLECEKALIQGTQALIAAPERRVATPTVRH